MSDLGALLTRCPHALLDFDGPVCSVFSGTSDRAVADQLRADLTELPDIVLASSDPFDVLRHAASQGSGFLARIARKFTDLELQAVATATPTPGAMDTMAALRRAGHTVTIVSNNSVPAVAAYLDAHGLAALVNGISARTEPSPDLLKPNPHLLLNAISTFHAQPGQCMLIGDSVTDITAAHAAGTSVVGYANKPGKCEQFAILGPDAIIASMFDLVDALSKVSADKL